MHRACSQERVPRRLVGEGLFVVRQVVVEEVGARAQAEVRVRVALLYVAWLEAAGVAQQELHRRELDLETSPCGSPSSEPSHCSTLCAS